MPRSSSSRSVGPSRCSSSRCGKRPLEHRAEPAHDDRVRRAGRAARPRGARSRSAPRRSPGRAAAPWRPAPRAGARPRRGSLVAAAAADPAQDRAAGGDLVALAQPPGRPLRARAARRRDRRVALRGVARRRSRPPSALAPTSSSSPGTATTSTPAGRRAGRTGRSRREAERGAEGEHDGRGGGRDDARERCAGLGTAPATSARARKAPPAGDGEPGSVGACERVRTASTAAFPSAATRSNPVYDVTLHVQPAAGRPAILAPDGRREAVLAALVAFAVAAVLTPLVARLARRVGAVDELKERGLARDATPLLGGLAIFAGALVAGLLFLPDNERTEAILAAAALITIVGRARRRLRPAARREARSARSRPRSCSSLRRQRRRVHVPVRRTTSTSATSAAPLTVFGARAADERRQLLRRHRRAGGGRVRDLRARRSRSSPSTSGATRRASSPRSPAAPRSAS